MERKTTSCVFILGSIENLRHLNDTPEERNIRMLDTYIKALYLHSTVSNDCKNIILAYLIWEIKTDDIIEAKDCAKKWYISVVLKCQPGQVFIHYMGWENRWDEWRSISRIALVGTKTDLGRFYVR